jgi:hypothetical protein
MIARRGFLGAVLGSGIAPAFIPLGRLMRPTMLASPRQQGALSMLPEILEAARRPLCAGDYFHIYGQVYVITRTCTAGFLDLARDAVRIA